MERKNLEVESESKSRDELYEKRLEQREKREQYLQTRLESQAQALKDQSLKIKLFQQEIDETNEANKATEVRSCSVLTKALC